MGLIFPSMSFIPTSQTPNLEVVHLSSKPFQIFPQDKTQKRYTDVGKTYIYDRHISLETNGLLPLLPIRLYAGATHMSAGSAISPYTDDIDKSTEEDIDYAAAPLALDASIHSKPLRKLKLTKQSHTLPAPFLPKVKETLSRLRFEVLLPRRDTLDLAQPIYDIYRAQPDETALELGELSFRQFIPQDSQSDREYFLMLPSDNTIIQKLQGQFSLKTAPDAVE